MNLLGSIDQDQYHQPNDEVQPFISQEPYLSSPTITLITINTSTSKEGYDCGEIEPYKNDFLRRLLRVIEARINSSRRRNIMSIRSRCKVIS